LVLGITGCRLRARLLRVDDKNADISLIHVAESAKDNRRNNELVALLKKELKKGARRPLYLLRYE
jgi:hypothetical protein